MHGRHRVHCAGSVTRARRSLAQPFRNASHCGDVSGVRLPKAGRTASLSIYREVVLRTPRGVPYLKTGTSHPRDFIRARGWSGFVAHRPSQRSIPELSPGAAVWSVGPAAPRRGANDGGLNVVSGKAFADPEEHGFTIQGLPPNYSASAVTFVGPMVQHRTLRIA